MGFLQNNPEGFKSRWEGRLDRRRDTLQDLKDRLDRARENDLSRNVRLKRRGAWREQRESVRTAKDKLAEYRAFNQSNFDVPKEVYPSSSSQSGIDWEGPLAGNLLEQLNQTGQNLPQLAEQLPEQVQNLYSNIMENALGPQAFQGTMNELAGRGMLSSSVAADALGRTGTNIMRDIGTKGYQSALEGTRAQMKVPSLLAQLAKLDEVRTAENANPLAPYQLMASLLGRF